MPLARTYSVALIGVTGHVVEVEADIANGLVGMILVGLPDTALREARDRIRAAIANSDADSRARSRHQGPAVDKRPLAIPPRGSPCPASTIWPASLLRRCWEGLQSGASTVSVRDAVAIRRLAHETQHDDALTERDAARRQIEEWQHGPWIIHNTIVRHYAQDTWPAVMTEVRKLRAAAPR